MAGAPKGNKNAKGSKGGYGVTLNDRELAASVRSLSLAKIKAVLDGELHADDPEFQKALLLKLASTVLPRISEVTGEGGAPLTVKVVDYGDHSPAQVRPAGVPAPDTQGF